MATSELHGLAANIRTASESEVFDLGNLPATTISQVIEDAFSQEFDLGQSDESMIRITLVVGAGKANRSKYDPSALKLVTTALNAAGYSNDSAASCIFECAGFYKFQHDTGKNLKTVVVFPKISTSSTNATKGGDASTPYSSLLPPDSLEYKIAVSTIPLFTNMLKAKFPSWSQKRSLLMLVDTELIEPLDEFDASLMKGGLLSPDQNKFYEQCISLSEKKGLIKDAMSQQVNDEKLTASEVEFLLEQVTARVDELHLQKQKNIPIALQERQAILRRIAKNPLPLSPLKHQAALGKLWKQAAPLMYLNNTGAKLLSPSETKKAGHLQDILNEISDLEQSSRGLLEDDESYEERIQTYRREMQQRYGKAAGNQKKSRGAGGGGASSSNVKNSTGKSTITDTNKFHTPHTGGRMGWVSAKDKKKKKSGQNKGGDIFSAMMADSDSDESDDDEEDDDDNPDDTSDVETSSTGITSTKNLKVGNSGKTTTNASSKKKKNRNKKKKNKNNDDAFLDAAVAANVKAAKEAAEVKNKTSTSNAKVEDAIDDGSSNVIALTLSVITEYIIPMILAVLTWFVTTLFGNNKSKNKKKKKA